MTSGTGIPAKAKAGAFGRSMWARRWAKDFESGVPRGDVQQGRIDARHDKVLSLDHSGRTVRCDVKGSRPLPFIVEFEFAPLDDSDAAALRRALRKEDGGILSALAGRYSETVGFLLLPAVHGATSCSCTCPVQPGPCRHVLAAAYIMVEWWDVFPEVLFALRGLGADELGVVLGGEGGDDRALALDVRESLWGDPTAMPVVPGLDPAGLEDLLDAPVTRRLAAAATPDPLEQLRVVADLEDFLDAFDTYAYRDTHGPR